ncbi:MAG: BTAD domain-containing putative transcriptional regulator [Firmicutes bacterium]|nr:BTAD domain-containing putative transcriptional regulator [Bacillota bacterium]
MNDANSLSLTLFGSPTLWWNGSPVFIASWRAQAFLWYMGAHAGQSLSRARIASLLWESGTDSERRDRLNTLLSRLRDSLPSWPFTGDNQRLAFDTSYAVDLTQFYACTTANGSAAPARRRQLAQALALWRGPFLQDFDSPPTESYDDWLVHERQIWEVRVLAVCEELIALDQAAGAWADMAQHAHQALLIDPLQERFHRTRMHALYALGDRAAALAQYEICRELLQRELGTAPHPTTVALAATISGFPPARSFSGFRAQAPAEHRTTATPLVGRHAILANLGDALKQAQQDMGQTILVEGTAGMGKTRILSELIAPPPTASATHIPSSFALVLAGRCYEETLGVPYATLATLLEGARNHQNVALHESAQWILDAARLIPELYEHAPMNASKPPPIDAHIVAQALTNLLASLPRPLLLILDDLQWADAPSLRFLASFLKSAEATGVVLLASVRPEDLAPCVMDFLLRQEEAQKLRRYALGPLTLNDVEALTRQYIGNATREWIALMQRATQGNPFFVTEILRTMRDTEELPDGSHIPLPPSVHAMLRRRVESLPTDAIQLLEALAILGTPVPLEFLRLVAHLSDDAALRAADLLLGRHLIMEQVDSLGSAASASLTLAHDLLRETVLRSINASRQAYWHRHAYETWLQWIDRHHVSHPYAVERLARHAEGAGLWEAHIHWAVKAAEFAEQVAAHDLVVQHLQSALSSLEHLPSTPLRRQRQLDLRLRLASFEWTRQPTHATQVVERTGQEVLSQRTNPPLDLFARQAEQFMLHGRLDAAIGLVSRLLPLARRAKHSALVATGLLVLAQLRALAGDLKGAVDPFEESRQLFDQLGQGFGYAQAAGTLGSVLATMGDFDHADDVLITLEERAQTWQYPLVTILAQLHRLTYYVLSEQWTAAAEVGQAGWNTCLRHGYSPYAYMMAVFLSLPLARLGQLERALNVANQAVAMGPHHGLRILQDRAHAYQALLLLEAGHIDDAQAAAQRGLAIARQDGYRYGVAFNTRILGEVAAARHEVTVAQEHLRDAGTLFAALGAVPDARRCTEILAGWPDSMHQLPIPKEQPPDQT